MKLGKPATLGLALAFFLAACGLTPPPNEGGETQMQKSSLQLTSSAFVDGGQIPQKYTCDGENINPPLSINDVPDQTQSLVLIVDDPDAPGGVWNHWLVWNIAPDTTAINENNIPPGAIQGTNSFGNQSWGGPCPPPGPAHAYVFRLYALDTPLNLASGAKKGELKTTMKGHVLARTQLIGRYGR